MYRCNCFYYSAATQNCSYSYCVDIWHECYSDKCACLCIVQMSWYGTAVATASAETASTHTMKWNSLQHVVHSNVVRTNEWIQYIVTNKIDVHLTVHPTTKKEIIFAAKATCIAYFLRLRYLNNNHVFIPIKRRTTEKYGPEKKTSEWITTNKN